MDRRRLFSTLAGIVTALIVSASAGELRHPLLRPGNVAVGAEPAARVEALWRLTEQALGELEVQRVGESDDRFRQRYENTRRLLLRIAWFESVQLQYRKQIRGPARSFYQIEPIRAMSCCQMAGRRGWMDELASACGQPQDDLQRACGALTPSAWPPGNRIEQCLISSDLFATEFARICLEPIDGSVPAAPEAQARWWANRWKRAFDSAGQRTRLMKRFVQSAAGVDDLLASPASP